MGDKIEGDMTRQHRPCLPSTQSSLPSHAFFQIILILYIQCMALLFPSHLLLLLLSPNFYFFPRWRVLRIQYLCLCCPLSPHMRKHNCFPSSIVKSVFVYMAITWGQNNQETLSVYLSACIYDHAWLDHSPLKTVFNSTSSS